ncbi:unnamed protein product [Effrenium voratum]|uniref:Nucleoporin Nup133/Nup155-like N-terminal domain-containing protein n=1 Tax=Effrenium voratum TaxID=2562239 RepID=A0AA36JAS1_9DINO|nr:unnamed protein product [Effrenium voratum]CAJ1451992.1 unnamed protein product [Effrenium voratum]
MDPSHVPDETLQRLVLPGRLVGEALAQDDLFLSVEETCPAGSGSADYEFKVPQLTVEAAGAGPPSGDFTQQGLLPDIGRLWRSFGSKIVLWRYDEPGTPEVTEYCGVSESVIAAATATPKNFIQGIDHFLVLATPLEVSLHALRFAGSNRLLPPVRTQFSVASDDIPMSAIACDPSSGRIFLGGADGCIHEFQYFDDDSRWLGRPRKCRKSAVSWNLQSQLPAVLQRACIAIFGHSEAIVQLSIDVSRGLLFALSALSSVTVFHIPSQKEAQNREEKPVVQICCLSASSIATEVGRIKARLFPGLLPASRGLSSFGAVVSASGLLSFPRLVKVLPMLKAVGGNVVACAVAEDGTRIYLRGVSKTSASDASQRARPAVITSVVVHHVRFLDASAPRDLQVKDALCENGVTLLQCRFGQEAGQKEAVIALSTDLRVVAQKQGRGRSPWVNVSGMAEHVDTINLTQEQAEGTQLAQIFAIAALPPPISKPIQQLFCSGNGLVLPVAHLSELAKQQLALVPRFMVISSIGVHLLRRLQPLDSLQEHLLGGNLMALQDFVGQYTAEQSCALMFQILTQAVPKLNALDASERAERAERVERVERLEAPRNRSRSRALGERSAVRDANEEVILLRTEQLLLSQLAVQLGFSQVLPSLDPGQPSIQGSPLGYSVMFQSAARLSARMRGLYLFLSRLLRPFWLSQAMLVVWPAVPSDKKRRRDEWWPPPPDPAPVAKGAQWRCAFSKSQRGFARHQLSLVKTVLDRCLSRLAREAEEDAAHGAWHLVAASMEALDFLELLSGCTTAMAAGACPEALLRLSELSFRDLVCQPEARRVLQQLMQAGIVACRDLANCPSLFSKADLEIQEAYEILKVVEANLVANSSALEIARLSHLTHRGLGILEQHAAHVNLMEAAARLRAVGACKGLVSLCSSVARARDPKDEAMRPQDPSNPRVQQLHYARLECYQVVLGILDDVLSFARQRGRMQSSFAMLPNPSTESGVQPELPELLPSRLSEVDTVPILDGLLRHCLEGHRYQADELFHFCILKWMMQSGLSPYQYKSPYLKNFLLVHAKKNPEMHCKYLQHNGRWAEACDAYLSLAKDAERSDPHSDNRLLMLQNAALCARMPRSNRRVEPILRMMSETLRTDIERPTSCQT